jgi:hypothetical protein
MSYLRFLSATLLSATCSFSLVTASGCGTSAVGVDDCRDIETARCRASKICGTVDDVDACERYVRDHCLHGLAGKAPGGTAVAACVNVIEAAARCATDDPDVALRDCDPQVTERASGLRKACDVVAHPERATECAFLADLPEEEDDGSGGAGGQPSEDESDESSTGSAAGASAGGKGSEGGAPAE